MPPTAAAEATRVMQLQRTELESAVQRWRQRLPRPEALGSAAEILDDVAGALWLELTASRKPSQQRFRCLRRVLYREYERNWRHPYVDPSRAPSHLTTATTPPRPEQELVGEQLDLPDHLMAWAQEYLESGGPEGRLDRGEKLCGSRRQTRLRNSAIFRALADGRFAKDLRKRAARLVTAAAVDGVTAPLRQEARQLLCMLKMLEANAEWTAMRKTISNIAAPRRPAGHAERAESANA